MKPPFDDEGNPNMEVEYMARTIEETIRRIMPDMLLQPYSVTEIRAVGNYLSQTVAEVIAEAAEKVAERVHQEKRRNADPNLDEEEKALANLWSSNPSSKIQAIRHYRERTGAGLKEAKDAVEAYIGDNL